MNVKPIFDGPHSPYPLGRALVRDSALQLSSQIADSGQSSAFGLSHRGRSVGSRLLGRQAFQQSPRFGVGADRGHLQDRSAVTGFDEALLVARWSELTVKYIAVQNAPLVDGVIKQAKGGLVPRDKRAVRPMSVLGELILLPKLQRQRSDDARAFDVGDTVGGISYGAPARTFGGLDLPYLNGNPRWALGMFVHAMADKLRQIGFGNRLLCHRSLPSGSNRSRELSRAEVTTSAREKSAFLQIVTNSQLLLDTRHSLCKIRIVPAFRGVRQRGPVAATNWNDCNSGFGEVGARELLVEEPDQLVGGHFLFGHGSQTS